MQKPRLAFAFSLLIAVIPCKIVKAQSIKASNLQRVLRQKTTDTARAIDLVALSYEYENYKPDSALLLAEESLALAEKLSYTRGVNAATNMIGLIFMTTGNYPKALQYLLGSLHGSQAVSDQHAIAVAMQNIGSVYSSQGDYRQAISYQLQSLEINNRQSASRNAAIALLDLGDDYEKLDRLDSALHYTRKCYQLVLTTGDTDLAGIALNNFGNIYSKMGNRQLAMSSYNQGIGYLRIADDQDDLCESYLGLAKLFRSADKSDSCLFYAKHAFQIASGAGFTDEIMKIANFLTGYYQDRREMDSAFAYQSAANVAKDSLYSQEKARQILSMGFDERIRERQSEEQTARERAQLKQNFLIGGLALVLIVAFFLYRSNQQKFRANKSLSVEKKKAEAALVELKAAQTQLIYTEKMASLGEMTTGIAHEIQNPLNFVNNFSDLNEELIDEMLREIDSGDFTTAKGHANDLKKNLEKIGHHGRRADAIVKAMLQHSRTGSGQRDLANLNTIAQEYLKLAYLGFRAKDICFKVMVKTDFDPEIQDMRVVSNDIGRMFMNLFNNAFYAVNEKRKLGNLAYRAAIIVSSTKKIDRVLFSVKDNGTGIPTSVLPKIFQPFFTTKPTGQGTGLGLSLCYDIAKAHGGEIYVESQEGEFSDFVLNLPA